MADRSRNDETRHGVNRPTLMEIIRRKNADCWRPLLAALVIIACAGCGESPRGDAKPALDPAVAARRGEEITEKMLAVYRDAVSYTDHATYVQQAAYRGEGVERELPFFQLSLAFERPNKVHLTLEESLSGSAGRKGYEIASDGTVMRAAAAEIPDQLVETPAPEKLTTENILPDPLIQEAFAGRALSDVFPQLAMLLDDGGQSLVFPRDDTPRLLGTETLRDRECFRVSTNNPAGKRVFWIDVNNYMLHRMELPIETQRKHLDAENQYSHLAVWIDFEEPMLNPTISRGTFATQAGASARRVHHLVAPPPPAPLTELGQPVAEFEFTPLSGPAVKRESLAGRTVLLAFWQINCAPCKAHTPLLESVFQQFKDDDSVATYAVNIEGPIVEDAAVEGTLRRWGTTMPILRDRTRSSLERLKIEGTPTLMIVGPDGRLQYVDTGEHRDSGGLADTIRRVRDGGDLAAEARAQHEKLVSDFEQALDRATIDSSSPTEKQTPVKTSAAVAAPPGS